MIQKALDVYFSTAVRCALNSAIRKSYKPRRRASRVLLGCCPCRPEKCRSGTRSQTFSLPLDALLNCSNVPSRLISCADDVRTTLLMQQVTPSAGGSTQPMCSWGVPLPGTKFLPTTHNSGELILVRLTCNRATQRCISTLGPVVIFDLSYRNAVLVAAGPGHQNILRVVVVIYCH